MFNRTQSPPGEKLIKCESCGQWRGSLTYIYAEKAYPICRTCRGKSQKRSEYIK